ncbi:MAG: Spx/MgsR family RNA polymerase-binding regulatory protein [Bdellovibrionota bacterium]
MGKTKTPKFYVHPKCSTCKAARNFLQKHDIAVEEIDITTQPPSNSELKRMLAFQGGQIRKLFNTSGIQYRELKIKERLDGLSESDALSMLTKNGMLVKRPFLLGETFGLVGFRENGWKETLR